MAWVEYKNTGYFISDNGLVRNKKGHILKLVNRGKYLAVNILGKQLSVHRLVASVYIANPHNFDIVNHKDGNKMNNTLSNLEWCDRSYNQHHAYMTRLQTAKKGIANISSKQVVMMNTTGLVVRIFGSIQEAATFVGLKSYTDISRCCSGERKHAAGYSWKWCNLPKSSIKKLIGRELSFSDEPVELK